MSNEENQQQPVEQKKEEKTSGSRGEVGQASAGLTIKQRWHEAKSQLGALSLGNSLKTFARRLAKEGDPVAKEWLANKRGARNEKRTDANIKAALEARQSSKAARRKTKSGGGK